MLFIICTTWAGEYLGYASKNTCTWSSIISIVSTQNPYSSAIRWSTSLVYWATSPTKKCFLYLGIETRWYLRSKTACFVLLVPMPQLYRKGPYLSKRSCLALQRVAFLPPASWRVSSGVFYDVISYTLGCPLKLLSLSTGSFFNKWPRNAKLVFVTLSPAIGYKVDESWTKKQMKVEHIYLTVGLMFWDIELIELPGLPQQITEKGEYLSIAKDYFGYKGKRVIVTRAAYQPHWPQMNPKRR